MNFFKRILMLWRRFRRLDRIEAVVQVDSMNDVPQTLGKSLYIVGNPNAKWALLQCPCGCGERIDINLMKARRPHWSVTVQAGLVTVDPSIWVPANRCGSHFWLDRNRILWVS